MSYENIILETVEPGICLLTVNRPRALNALNPETLEEIGQAVDEVRRDTDARVLLVTGAGEKAFVAGADISRMQSMNALEGKAFSELGLRTCRSLELLPIPTIAVVNGYALGGGTELAMSCDWIFASERAVFGQPEVNLGVTPGFGGTQRLTRLVGRAMAMELVTTGRQVKADEALRIGLANRVVAPEGLMEAALESARLIASRGPVAVRLAKEAIQRGQDLELDAALVLESEVFGLCFATEDQKEGMAAFLEKRAPEFKGC
ncbi:MAG: short-chain-enoyl-CoA hydratase [Gammaproteobacteria bacterium]